MSTPAETRAALKILLAVAEYIRDMPSQSVPAGVLYAALSSQGCSKSQFDGIIETLCSGNPPLVVRRDYLLVWNGDAVLAADPDAHAAEQERQASLIDGRYAGIDRPSRR